MNIPVTISLPGPVRTHILSALHGPGGKTVALQIPEAQLSSMTTPEEAGLLIVGATERQERNCVFPENLKPLYYMRAGTEESQKRADAVMAGLYNNMGRSVRDGVKL